MAIAGFMKSINGKYLLTSFSRIAYEAQLLLLERPCRVFWKLKAIDSIECSTQVFTIEERIKIIDSLIIDNDLKDMLFGRNKEKDIKQELVPQHRRQLGRRLSQVFCAAYMRRRINILSF